jgi:hypothetical protein
MFCPFCQAEYRDGFAECSDCRVSLVTSQEQAKDLLATLWQGQSQYSQHCILEALRDEGIPCHSKIPVEFRNGDVRLESLKISFEVWVLRKDIERAREAISKFT